MGYELHIERAGAGIALEEWRAAVEAVDGVTIHEEDITARNPMTGEMIVLPARPGTAGVDQDDKFVPVYRWHDGRVSFKASFGVEDPEDPIWRVTKALAIKLSARIVGDEGELYGQDE